MDPVLLDVIGPLKLRWYGLGYLLGFVAAFYLLRWLARKNLWVLAENKVSDFIAYGAFFGVFLGGRLGYILFYQIPKDNWAGLSELLADPMMLIRVWDGGMASHGGILGLTVFTLIYAKKNKVSWAAVADGLCVVGPLGVCFVRIANFINGELYGRAADGVKWAVKFPQSLSDDIKNDPEKLAALSNELPGLTQWNPSFWGNYLAEQSIANPELIDIYGKYLVARHPSQLYQALLEGALVFAILFFLRVKFPKLAHGVITGAFFILYAFFRIIVEGYREPDSAMIGMLTKGQFYSLFMILIGIAFLAGAWIQSKKRA